MWPVPTLQLYTKIKQKLREKIIIETPNTQHRRISDPTTTCTSWEHTGTQQRGWLPLSFRVRAEVVWGLHYLDMSTQIPCDYGQSCYVCTSTENRNQGIGRCGRFPPWKFLQAPKGCRGTHISWISLQSEFLIPTRCFHVSLWATAAFCEGQSKHEYGAL